MTFEEQRQRMVAGQLMVRGIKDGRILSAFSKVPRHLFVPPALRSKSYEDRPCPIGAGQTISQPYIVALMTEQLSLPPGARVLEIGTGSGYQTAILAELASQVYSIERIPALAETASEILLELGYQNVQIRVGDGSQGWPEEAPFDGILVAAAAPQVPHPLLDHLAEGGRLVIPIGAPLNQTLTVVQRHEGQTKIHAVCQCVFVPLIGAHGWGDGEVPAEETNE